MSTALLPQYITDEAGKRVSVIIPVEAFEELLEEVSDLAAIAERRGWMKPFRAGVACSLSFRPKGEILHRKAPKISPFGRNDRN